MVRLDMILPKLDDTIPLAYLNIRGAELAVAFFDPEFGTLSPEQRRASYEALRASVARQGFRGDVAAVWQDPAGRMRFMAPPQQHPFFQVTQYRQLRAQINGTAEGVLC